MELPIKLVMPWPPSVNSLYFQGKTHGQKFLSKKGKEYKNTLHRLHSNDDLNPVTVPIKIRIEFFQPDNRTRDLDNYVKPILDGLKYLELIEDDSLVTTLLVIKHEKVSEFNKGLVLVYLKEDKSVGKDRSKIIKEYVGLNGFGEDEMIEFHKPSLKIKARLPSALDK